MTLHSRRAVNSNGVFGVRSVWSRLAACLCLAAFSLPAFAHKQSDSYLSITQPAEGAALTVQWDIALRDLEHAIGLDTNADGAITWGELKQRQAAISGYAEAHLTIISGEASACPLHFEQMLVDEHVDGKYAVLRFSARCAERAARIDVSYSSLFDIDPNHHGLLNLTSGGNSRAAVFSASSGRQTFELDSTRRDSQFGAFLKDGIWHIWEGYDHVLFLLTLLLPAVVLYRDRQWQPRESLRDALIDVVKVVTAFTLAHSITLTLGAMGWVYVPTRLVESAIALTVLFGALNILVPVVRERRWLLAFVFGLIHGLAFASVLIDLGLQGWNLLLALLGFNAGVEVGQLAIVAVVVPLMYAARRTAAFRKGFMPLGAVIVSGVAAYWFVSRAFLE